MTDTRESSQADERAGGALAVGMEVTIRKLSSAGAPVFAYSGVVAQTLEAGARLHATWTRGRMELGYTTFEPGDRFVEWFYTDRWYNIMEVHGSGDSGALKGWYCNITYPAEFDDATVSYRDLALDLWVAPDGAMTTLDEDEFAADAAIDPYARAQALATLDALREMVSRRLAPFDTLPD
ncbi:MAG TPA: DUF402 domain-containing protein [Ktedonobacterales bacterium]